MIPVPTIGGGNVTHAISLTLGIAILLMFASTSATAASPTQPAVCPALENKQQERDLDRAAQKLLEVMRRGDIEELIALLADEVDVDTDVVVKKAMLARNLRQRQRTYVHLFDTARYRAEVEKWRERLTPEQRAAMPPLESIGSVQDHLIAAPHVEIRVCFLPAEAPTERTFAVVGFDWKGRPGRKELPNSMFVLTKRGWRISGLFTIDAWQVAPPSYRP